MAYALGHDRGAEILLKSVQRLTHKEAENHIGTAVVKVEDIASPEDAQLIENREVCESSVGPSIPSNKFPMYFEEPPSATEILSTLSALELETDMQPYNDTGISGVPTYPTIPKLQPSDVTDTIHQADGLTIPRSKPSLGSSHNKLPTVIESKPSNHQLTGISFEEAVPTISITETDRLVASNNAITSTSNMLLHLPSSRTSTMCSAVSAKSHQEPGPIHINPSAQLQSMQSISELDSRLTEVSNLRKPWGKPRYDRISGQGTYTTTGTPESISKVPLSAGLFEAHSRLNDNLLSQYVDEVAKYDWARSSEWVEPCAVDDGPKEWIEDYLTRQEQADRDEESERQRQEKQDKRYRGIRSRVNSTDKFRRKLSKKRVTKEWGSFEARQERKNAMVFDLDAGSSPRRRTSIPIPGEDLEKPERARAFSWSPDTPQDLISENALLNQSSWAPKPSTLKSSSQAHFTNPLDAILLPKRKPNETPLDRIYVMYHYLIRGDYEVLRNEGQDFFDHQHWHVQSIPDPRDYDPERYAILATITQYLAHGINRRIKISQGYRKDLIGPWRTAAYEFLQGTKGDLPIFETLDREPKWAGKVKMVESGLEICQGWASEVWGERRSLRFAAKGIISTEIVECFI
ncbi:hypothetical protein G6011_11279 [Alternaria panax]|uniref:Uncharacterized protein n=1 Tax=Alternaria panax TaxID=48097 RepID=A0AAD4IDC1_9PLEO|nr:hypothetical protein G6011_11279 [Alternaria panax]